MSALPDTTLLLSSGARIPKVGLGVWQTPSGATTRNAVAAALEVGYRHIDTARIYGNEADVGAAVRDSGVAREQVFVTTKLWNADQGYEPALRAFDASGRRLDSWRALERIHEQGRARSIGVSNFLLPHLDELLSKASTAPSVNQIEVTPFLQRRETRALCAGNGIVVEAYSPLTHGQRLDDPVVANIARRVGRSAAQVLLRWGLQHDLVVLPKSTKPARIAENGALFDFTLDHRAMAELDALEDGFVAGWDPAEQV